MFKIFENRGFGFRCPFGKPGPRKTVNSRTQHIWWRQSLNPATWQPRLGGNEFVHGYIVGGVPTQNAYCDAEGPWPEVGLEELAPRI